MGIHVHCARRCSVFHLTCTKGCHHATWGSSPLGPAVKKAFSLAEKSPALHSQSLVNGVSMVCAGRHVASVPLQRGTEVCAFNPRYKQLLALAEPCVVMSSYRDSKSKDTLACLVSLVQLK